MTTFTSSSYDKGVVEVSLNHLNFNEQGDVLFVKVSEGRGYSARSNYSTLSLADAKKLGAHINALVEQFEGLKPKPLTRRETIEAFPVGTVFSTKFSSYSDRSRWVRTEEGVVKLNDASSGTWNLSHFSKHETSTADLIIEYKPKEDA